MKIYVVAAFLFLAVSGCVEQSSNKRFTDLQRSQSTEIATLCALDKADQFASQLGSPSELGMLAARSCREDIVLATYIHADGNERIAARLLPDFIQATAETAALYIAEKRAS